MRHWGDIGITLTFGSRAAHVDVAKEVNDARTVEDLKLEGNVQFSEYKSRCLRRVVARRANAGIEY